MENLWESVWGKFPFFIFSKEDQKEIVWVKMSSLFLSCIVLN